MRDDYRVIRSHISRVPAAIRIVGVDEHHPAAAEDAAVAVVHAVDRGVELIMAPQCLQHQLTGADLQQLHQ